LVIKNQERNEEISSLISLASKEYKYSNFIYKCLDKIYGFYTNKNKKKIFKNIFNSIHYKDIRGIRLEIKGRLT
jgi:hypothetical protein